MTDLTGKALNLIRNHVKVDEERQAERMAELEENIPMYTWMWRNNVDRAEVVKLLTELVDYGCLESAKAIIQLKIGQGDGQGTLETLRAATDG